MDHTRAASLHAARAYAHADARKACAHALRAEYHAGFGLVRTTTDPRVSRLDTRTIRAVMTQHKDAICAGTFDPPIGSWDVSGVFDMSRLFAGWTRFNRPIGAWDTRNVRSMRGMFEDARAFDQPIGVWNVSKVEDMSQMFDGARAFNQPIGTWNVSKVGTMRRMFAVAEAFNQPLGGWKTQDAYAMDEMFAYAASFNQALTLETRSVKSMAGMFREARAYNNGGEPLVLRTRMAQLMPHMFCHSGLRHEVTLSDMSGVRDVRMMFEGCEDAACCVTRRVSSTADGLAEQRARIREDPNMQA
jgi:hypothetical protein